MAVNGEELLASSSSVDQSQTMRLPLFEFELRQGCITRARHAVMNGGAVEVHLAIDQVVV